MQKQLTKEKAIFKYTRDGVDYEKVFDHKGYYLLVGKESIYCKFTFAIFYKDDSMGRKYLFNWQFPPTFYYKIKEKLRTTIVGKYLRWTNKTQKEALRFLERCEPIEIQDRHTIICTEQGCTFSTIYRDTYEKHISEAHGYPSDMVVSAYMTEAKVEPATGYIKKANSDYLKYL
jgi:hypothetical protein